MRRFLTVAAASLVLAVVQPIGTADAATITNGGFETGDFTGWTVTNPCNSAPSSSWFPYTGTTSPLTGSAISAPPEGAFAAVTDQVLPGTHILHQDIALEPGTSHVLSFTVYYRNRASAFTTPPNLSCNTGPNQQYRVDVVNPSAPIDSVAPGDVLATIFQTSVGDPLSINPKPITFDLTPFAGQTVRLRFAQVDNQGLFQASVDDVVVQTAHTLKFFLHGNDIPGTAGGFTMNQTAAPTQTLTLNLLSAPRWYSDPTLTGTFLPGATFQLTIPCTSLGLGLLTTYSLAATDPGGGNPQALGQVSQPLTLCTGQRIVTIPVTTPVVLTDDRLRLTISSALAVTLNLQLGVNTFLTATNFIGTP